MVTFYFSYFVLLLSWNIFCKNIYLNHYNVKVSIDTKTIIIIFKGETERTTPDAWPGHQSKPIVSTNALHTFSYLELLSGMSERSSDIIVISNNYKFNHIRQLELVEELETGF